MATRSRARERPQGAILDPTILNAGLSLAMQFGEHWLEPIQQRLSKLYPKLSRKDLNVYDKLCRKAMDFGHEHLPDCWSRANRDQREAFKLFHVDVRREYPWIDDANLSRLFSQGCYYAYKDGVL